MKRFHIAIGVADIALSVADYSSRIGCAPVLVLNGEYALWRTDTLNLSIRKLTGEAGLVRHLGWEESHTPFFQSEKDVNGIAWEYFTAQQQAEEIHQLWPNVEYKPE